jgi:hypothetical protein
MAIESDGHSRGNPRIYELLENAPKTGKSPTIWAWPEVMDWFRVAGQPVPGPWPPHQQARPNPEEESLPVAVVEPERSEPAPRRAQPAPAPRRAAPSDDAPRPAAASQDDDSSSQGGVGSQDASPPPRHGLGLMDT